MTLTSAVLVLKLCSRDTFFYKRFFLAALIASVYSAGQDYSQNGDNWTGTCATGQKQSPIMIDPSKTDEIVTKTSFEEFKVAGYDLPQTWTITNKGKTVQLDPADARYNIYIRILPINEIYKNLIFISNIFKTENYS